MLNIYNICFPLVNEKKKYLGTAFKWNEKFYVTCKHVVKDQREITIVFDIEGDQKAYKITKNLCSKKYDLCLFEIEQNRHEKSLIQSTEELSMGQDVILLGFTSTTPGVIEPRCIKTYIHRARAKPDDWLVDSFGLISINELNIQIPRGFSGGPVISSNNNQLLGMILGTNAIENNCYIVEDEVTTTGNEKTSIQIKEKTYFGLIHTIKDIQDIISSESPI
ncbi:TPA: trypsin-like peptidase domain-containing protein [Legionella pneumophila]|jgi:hypothetical protein|nr:trypsin-like peptidase domain-containing protein [Legionella pneumophila]